MKDDFATKILLRNVRMCQLLANRIGIRRFFYHVQHLTNIEEQSKSFTGANDTK